MTVFLGVTDSLNHNLCVSVCRDVNALWSGAHALAFHLEEAFRTDSAAWALEKCLKWDQEEKLMPSFLTEIADCPCTLAQARADTGRFHVRINETELKGAGYR